MTSVRPVDRIHGQEDHGRGEHRHRRIRSGEYGGIGGSTVGKLWYGRMRVGTVVIDRLEMGTVEWRRVR